MRTWSVTIPDDRGKKYEYFRYPAGEIQVRIHEAELPFLGIADRIQVRADIRDGEVMELVLLSNAICRNSRPNAILALSMPYLPYARADRQFVQGDCFGLQAFATVINSLGYNSVETFDVHSEKAGLFIQNFINLSPTEHYDQLTPIIAEIGNNDLALVLPDKGASRYNLGKYNLPVLQAEKIRNPETGKLSGFGIDDNITRFDKALIVDDICDGGGTFVGLAQAIKKLKPGIRLYLYVSHGIFSKGLVELNLWFERVFISDYSFKNLSGIEFEDMRVAKTAEGTK